jgi:hypothetical protein
VNTELIRQSIKTEIERAKAAWTAYALAVEYENTEPIDLAMQFNPFLCVDIVFRDGAQMDMNPDPLLRVDGQIIVAVGTKVGSGTAAASALLDFVVPYLQLRDDMLHGVRTHEAKPHEPKTVNGHYYLPFVVGFWRDAVKPATP